MKFYHLVILFIVVVALIAPKLIALIGVVAGIASVFLWLLAAALGFPGWRSKNRP
ncbi:hypothetical protein P3W55_02045 [Pseudomonas citronellolis]|uniref:Uncharacterized protein n=1 Tax=Pseudomonas citronellolis TaxID=53408 RepID=A0AAW6NYY0_9PSED|nr:hypothetical protein [Pseudomonas citronellolis]MDF3840486.1 hypothetical protein [Pseudomonas citronellolis]WRT82941.1 hypothetical protein VK748_00450 [Pseudomonas citronellolis]